MDSTLKKSSDRSRTLLFGLLVNCIFSKDIKEKCPLWELRSSLTSIEKKDDDGMGGSEEEINSILVKHEECYVTGLKGIM